MSLHLLAQTYAPGPQDEVGRGIHEPHQRPEEEHKNLQGAADPKRRRLGSLNGEVLGRLLSEDQVRVGYDREPEYHRYELDDRLVGHPQRFKARGDEGRHGGLPNPTQGERSNGDPDLADGEVRVEISQDTVDYPRPVAPFLL